MADRVLFICTGNSARSQMAEALLRNYAADRFEAYSAGLDPRPVNPLTVQVMDEAGLDLSGQHSKSVTEYLGKLHFAYVITVCTVAEERCPSVFPGMGQRMRWSFEDPAAFRGSEEARLDKFREVRDQIDGQIRAWLEGQGVRVGPRPRALNLDVAGQTVGTNSGSGEAEGAIRKKVLFLCTGNSARSQMAEGLVNHLLSGEWTAWSAGTHPAAAVHPLAVQVMAEIGIDISAQLPKPASVFFGSRFDLVVTVCDDAAEECPVWLGQGRRAHLGFPDPARVTGSPAQELAAFLSVRDDMRHRVPECLRQAAL
jgi:arsenate reductase